MTAATVEKLNGKLGKDGDVGPDFQLNSTGDRVFYTAYQNTDYQYELYSVPIEGGVAEKLNGPLIENGSVSYYFRISPIDDLVVYRADQEIDGQFELFASYINQAPQFLAVLVPKAVVGAEFDLTLETADGNSFDILTIESEEMPSWLTLTDHGDGTATLSGTPKESDIGSQTVSLKVTDMGGSFRTTTFTVEVEDKPAPVNQAPVFLTVTVPKAVVGSAYTLTVKAADGNPNDTLIIEATEKPNWLNFIDNGDGTAALSGTPAEGDVGEHMVTLKVTDSIGATGTTELMIEVENHISKAFLPYVAP